MNVPLLKILFCILGCSQQNMTNGYMLANLDKQVLGIPLGKDCFTREKFNFSEEVKHFFSERKSASFCVQNCLKNNHFDYFRLVEKWLHLVFFR